MALSRQGWSAQKCVYPSLYLLSGKNPYSLIDNVAAVVKKECWHTPNVVLRSCSLSFIHIHLNDFYPSCIFFCQFIQNRFKVLAVPSPGSRELNENGAGEFYHFIGKIVVEDIDWSIRIQSTGIKPRFAFAAHGLAPSRTWYPVFCSTLRTPYDIRIVHDYTSVSSCKDNICRTVGISRGYLLQGDILKLHL